MPTKARTLHDLAKPQQVEGCFVVCGPPGSGKTTWAQQHAQGPIWDMDREAARLGYVATFPRPPQQHQHLMWLREEFIEKHMGLPMCVIITNQDEAELVAKRIGAKLKVLKGRSLRAVQHKPNNHKYNKRYGRRHRDWRAQLLRHHLAECMLHNRHPCDDCWQGYRHAFTLDVPLELHHKCKIEDYPELQYDAANVVFLCRRHHAEHTRKGE